MNFSSIVTTITTSTTQKKRKKKTPLQQQQKLICGFGLFVVFLCFLFCFVLFLFCFSLCDGDRESTGRQGVKMMMTKKKKR
jgi:magnesium-transporting ATPase (P-type)